jgi:hypothetical protein
MTNRSEVEIKESIMGRETFRLLEISQNPKIEDLLDEALDGREKTVESVSKLYNFVLRNFGEGKATAGPAGSRTTDKFWQACSAFLRESGMTDVELSRLRYPYPRTGEPGFVSILDEMGATDHVQQ